MIEPFSGKGQTNRVSAGARLVRSVFEVRGQRRKGPVSYSRANWGQLRKRKFTYAKGRCLLVEESAKSCHEERWTSRTKHRIPHTSFPPNHPLIHLSSVLFYSSTSLN